MRYLYIFATLFFTVYGQLILKWRIGKLAFALPDGGIWDKFMALIRLIFDPFFFGVLFQLLSLLCFGWQP